MKIEIETTGGLSTVCIDTLEGLKAMTYIRDRAEWDLEKAIGDTDKIADNMRDYWPHLGQAE